MRRSARFPTQINTRKNAASSDSVLAFVLQLGRCVLGSPWRHCRLFCDAQKCDQTHPRDVGYARLAKLVYKSLMLGHAY